MSFVIESGVELTRQDRKKANQLIETLRLLDVGQSFVFDQTGLKHHRQRIYKEGIQSKKCFAVRTVDATSLRVWRTA